MLKHILTILLILSIIIAPSFPYKRTDFRKGMDKNVCKDLKDDVLLYIIFVDNKHTAPWTEYDIQSTMDSIKITVEWIHDQAKKNDVKVNIVTDYYLGEEFSTIHKALPEESLVKSINTPNLRQGLLILNKWADHITRKAGESFDLQEKEGIPGVKKPKNKERLIAYLRDKHKLESVALLLMVNNYYKDDISLPVNTMNSDDVEFAVVSFKYPSVIAHNLLHLFGAADLWETIYRKNEKNIKYAAREFPDEIMQDVYAKKISDLTISPYTKYLIGWTDTLESKYNELLFDKRARIK